MVTAAEVLTGQGTQRATEVVELARAAGLEIAAAATLLEKESGGGHNVWGHDDVPTGGHYVKGAEVTKDAYLNYKADRAQLGAQGVGPTQLTFEGFQDQADDRGGCWDWRVNCAVGFEILAGYMRTEGGEHGAFLAYNGATSYADDAVQKLAVWRSRLEDASDLMAALTDGSSPDSLSPRIGIEMFILRADNHGPLVLVVGNHRTTINNAQRTALANQKVPEVNLTTDTRLYDALVSRLDG